MTAQLPDIRLKRAYDPPGDEDGLRILVDRLWPRGIRKEELRLALWLKEIAPTSELRKWFAHDPEKFDEFSRRYRQELDENTEAVQRITALMEQSPVTLIYAAHDPAHNQAIVLERYLHEHAKRTSPKPL